MGGVMGCTACTVPRKTRSALVQQIRPKHPYLAPEYVRAKQQVFWCRWIRCQAGWTLAVVVVRDNDEHNQVFAVQPLQTLNQGTELVYLGALGRKEWHPVVKIVLGADDQKNKLFELYPVQIWRDKHLYASITRQAGWFGRPRLSLSIAYCDADPATPHEQTHFVLTSQGVANSRGEYVALFEELPAVDCAVQEVSFVLTTASGADNTLWVAVMSACKLALLTAGMSLADYRAGHDSGRGQQTTTASTTGGPAIGAMAAEGSPQGWNGTSTSSAWGSRSTEDGPRSSGIGERMTRSGGKRAGTGDRMAGSGARKAGKEVGEVSAEGDMGEEIGGELRGSSDRRQRRGETSLAGRGRRDGNRHGSTREDDEQM